MRQKRKPYLPPIIRYRYIGLPEIARRMQVDKAVILRLNRDEGFPLDTFFSRHSWWYCAYEERIQAWWAARESIARKRLQTTAKARKMPHRS